MKSTVMLILPMDGSVDATPFRIRAKVKGFFN